MLFGCSAPLISTLTHAGSTLSFAGLLYGGATLGLLAVRLSRGTQAETPVTRQDWPALMALTLLGGGVDPVALVLGHPFPALQVTLALLVIGAVGFGISIWLDLLALRDLGAAREAVLFSSAPFVGTLFSWLILRESVSPQLLVAAGLMAAGVVLLLREQHSRKLGERDTHERPQMPSPALARVRGVGWCGAEGWSA